MCPSFFECAHNALADVVNRSAETRHACIASVAGQTCAARTAARFETAQAWLRFVVGNFAGIRTLVGRCLCSPTSVRVPPATDFDFIRRNGGWTRTGHEGICFEYGCLHCAIGQFQRYFDCAVQCSAAPESVE